MNYTLIIARSINVFWLGIIFFVMYMAFWPVNVMDFHNSEILTPIVEQGGTLRYRLTYSKHRNVYGDIYRNLIGVDNELQFIIIGARTGNLPVGKNQTAESWVIIPVTTVPGKYRLRASGRWEVNPLRYDHDEWTSGIFEVVKRGSKP